MPFTFDGSTRTITEVALPGNPAIASYDVLTDLFSPACEWWQAYPFNFPFRQEGGGFRQNDNQGNPTYATVDLYLQNQAGEDWRIKFADYSTPWGYRVVRLSGANLLAEDPNLALYNLAGMVNPVVVIPELSNVQSGYFLSTEGGSGLTAGQIWNYSGRSLTTSPPGTATTSDINTLATAIAQLQSIATRIEQLTGGRYKIDDSGQMTFYGSDNTTVLQRFQLMKDGSNVNTADVEIDERRVI